MSQYNRLLKSLAMNANNRKIESEASGGTNYYTTGATLGGNNILTGSTQASTWTADLSALAAVGTIGGSITDNQVAFGASTPNNIEGSANFTYNGTVVDINGNLRVQDGHTLAAGDSDDLYLYHDGNSTIRSNTGVMNIVQNAAANLVMSTNSNSNQLVLEQANGRVGIGTAGPATKLDVLGSITAGANSYTTISNNEYDVSSGDLLFDVAGDITLDAGGSDIKLSKAGGNKASFYLTTSDVYFQLKAADGDFYITGMDDTSQITALHLDMSEAGLATFNTTPVVGTMTSSDNSTKAASTAYVTTAVAANTGTPGGSDTQVQFNDGGAFGGSANLTWDDSDLAIGNSGKLKVVNASSNYWAMYNQSNGKMRIDQGTTQRVLASSGEFQFANDIIVDSKVGIGGVTPSYPLHVAQGTATYGIYMPNSNSRGIRFGDTSNNGTGYGRIEGIGGSLFLGSTQIYTSFIGTGDSNTTLGSQGRRWSYFFTRFGQVGYDTSTTTTAQFGISGASDKVPLEVYANGATAPAIHVTSGSLVGIGLDTPTSDLHIKGELDIQSGNQTILMGAGNSSTSRSNDTLKLARVGLAHYHNAEEPVAMLYAASNGTDNTVVMGGGTSGMNAATRLQFATAVNDATTAGTVRASIQGDANYDKLFLGADTTLGFYRYSNRMDFYISSNPRMHLDASKLYSATSGGPLLDLTPTTNEANYGFVDDPDTGMSRTAANTLVLMTAGTTRMTISSAGNATFTEAVTLGDNSITNTQSLGNNTTRIATTEFVAAALTAGGYGNVSKVGTPANNQIGVWTGDGTIEGDANLTYDGSNVNVGTKVELQGAGTSTFSAANTVFGASDVSQNTYLKVLGSGAGYTAAGIKLLTYNGANRPGGVYSYNNVDAEAWYSGPVYGNSFKWGVNYKSSLANTGSALEEVAAVGNNLLTIDTAGNVGIGTSSPQKPLHVLTSANDTGILIDVSDDTHEGRLIFGDTSSNGIGHIGYNHDLDAMRFFTNNAESLRLESDQDAVFYGNIIATGATAHVIVGQYTRLQRNTNTNGLHLTDSGGNAVAYTTLSGATGGFWLDNTTSNKIYRGSGVSFWDSTESYRLQGNTTSGYLELNLNKISLVRNASSAASAMLTLGDGGTYDQFSILEDQRGSTATNGFLKLRAKKTGNFGYRKISLAAISGSTTSELMVDSISTNEALRFDTNSKSHALDIAKAGYVSIGAAVSTTDALYVNGNTTINGVLSATAKSFNIPHPLYKDKRLVHGSLEGPEHAIYIRGTIETEEKGCLVELPEYWSAMCEDYTVQLTPHGPYTVYIKEKLKDKVMIECSQKKFKFDYYIVGARTDETLEVVKDA
jgi:hypothetical protein